MAVTITKLQVYPQGLDHFSFNEYKRRGLVGRGGFLRSGFGESSKVGYGGLRLRLRQCRSSKSEDEGEVEVKETEKERKLKKRDGFWRILKDGFSGVGKSGSLSQEENRKAVAKLEELFSSVALQIGRYLVTMTSTGVVLAVGFQLSGGDSQMNELIWYSWLGGIIIGTMIGANMVLEEHCRAGPRNVVITGSTRGLGKALAREFLLSGDHVVVASRSAESVDMTVKELEESLREGLATSNGSAKANLSRAKVVGIACDVCQPSDVKKLANFAVSEFGSVDIWINNAGTNKGFRPLLQFSDEDIKQIVSTNLVGSILCTQEAMRVMMNQPRGGHIFNMDGAGSGGSSTPLTAVYGSTKCGLRQLHSSLLKECKRSKVGVHTASPGMVLTDLLLSGSTLKNKQMFNIICELPETVARTLVPRMRVVKGTGKAINYLTPPRIVLALVTAWLRRGRWFDDQGRALYAAEADRLRNWAEDRARFSFTDAMEMYTENTWVSVFSLSVVCAFIILSSTSSTFPGT
ncbi:putative chlorophyll(ide) b reductase nyc1, chloroplastic [Turnera subulata]|uniref:chlorophyll(ide) b reductase n=1 Tax=Turnera subulata TaxID=218843 RepID=A0A9Q0F0Y6_9ROSI|nr:putative chlorophyll(ide) b reductase nyc1, chloroplastic [Turnera subulata]